MATKCRHLSDNEVDPGFHLYVWRKLHSYHHHGIVIGKNDLLKANHPYNLVKGEGPFIIEQNVYGLDIVSLDEFRLERFIVHHHHSLNRALYDIPNAPVHSYHNGVRYKQKCLPFDKVIINAVRAINCRREESIWNSYSLVTRNCEQFALLCCTDQHYLGNQVSNVFKRIPMVFVGGMGSAVEKAYKFFDDMAVTAMKDNQNVCKTIEEIVIKRLTDELVGSRVGVWAEAIVLSIRLMIYNKFVDSRGANLAKKWAITPNDYRTLMNNAGFNHLAFFGLHILDMLKDKELETSSMVSQLFAGVIGLWAARELISRIIRKIQLPEQKIQGKLRKREYSSEEVLWERRICTNSSYEKSMIMPIYGSTSGKVQNGSVPIDCPPKMLPDDLYESDNNISPFAEILAVLDGPLKRHVEDYVNKNLEFVDAILHILPYFAVLFNDKEQVTDQHTSALKCLQKRLADSATSTNDANLAPSKKAIDQAENDVIIVMDYFNYFCEYVENLKKP